MITTSYDTSSSVSSVDINTRLLLLSLENNNGKYVVKDIIPFAAVTYAKVAIYSCSIMLKLGFPCDSPTAIYEDNALLAYISTLKSLQNKQDTLIIQVLVLTMKLLPSQLK